MLFNKNFSKKHYENDLSYASLKVTLGDYIKVILICMLKGTLVTNGSGCGANSMR